MNRKIEIDRSDLQKIYDALHAATVFFEKRDQMNSQIHLSETRYSPITSRLQNEGQRIRNLLFNETNETHE